MNRRLELTLRECFVGARQGPNALPARKAFDARSRLGWRTIAVPLLRKRWQRHRGEAVCSASLLTGNNQNQLPP